MALVKTSTAGKTNEGRAVLDWHKSARYNVRIPVSIPGLARGEAMKHNLSPRGCALETCRRTFNMRTLFSALCRPAGKKSIFWRRYDGRAGLLWELSFAPGKRRHSDAWLCI